MLGDNMCTKWSSTHLHLQESRSLDKTQVPNKEQKVSFEERLISYVSYWLDYLIHKYHLSQEENATAKS